MPTRLRAGVRGRRQALPRSWHQEGRPQACRDQGRRLRGQVGRRAGAAAQREPRRRPGGAGLACRPTEGTGRPTACVNAVRHGVSQLLRQLLERMRVLSETEHPLPATRRAWRKVRADAADVAALGGPKRVYKRPARVVVISPLAFAKGRRAWARACHAPVLCRSAWSLQLCVWSGGGPSAAVTEAAILRITPAASGAASARRCGRASTTARTPRW